MFLKYDALLSCNQESIDRDHRQFIAFLDDVLIVASDEDLVCDVLGMAEHCTEYVANHLYMELIMMRTINYPHIESHIQDHDRVCRDLQAVVNGMRDGEENVKYKLFTWVIAYAHRHINTHDRELIRFCQEPEVLNTLSASTWLN